VEEALSLGATKIAMFDDDEIVSEEWLVELHSALVKSGADGVCGTVCRLLPTRSPDLIKKLWGNSRNPPNATVPLMGTNNCLFSAKLVRADGLNIRFDHGFNFSGREDTAFSLDAQLKGAKFVAAPDAIAIEKFPPARCTFGYLMLRYFDTGVSDIKIAERYGFSKIRRTMRELVAIPLRLLSLPFVAIMGLKRPAHAVLMIAASVGWLCGLFGKSSEYYLKHGGTP
jgi:succinoglycan biosynthesis protein ExoM